MRLRLLSFVLPLLALPLVHCSSETRSGFKDGTLDPGSSGGPGFDNGDAGKAPDAQVAFDKCKVPPDGDNGGGLECTKSSPPNSFTPKIKWTWSPPGGSSGGGFGAIAGSMVTPLVGNFTDDNGDGVIDLCDTPDVLVTTGGGGPGAAGKIYMLAGDTGQLEVTFGADVDASVNPAFGDLDGDGVPEVVANDPQGHIVVFEAGGAVKWRGTDVGVYHSQMNSYCHAIAIYDLDADGTPEIIAAFEVFDSKGKKLFGHDVTSFQSQYWCPANTAADLDGDGKLEVIFGNAAYHHDGSVFWTIPGPPGQPQVANLDADPEPEIFVARQDGILVIEHDGKVKFGPLNLTGDSTPSPQCWSKPGAVHDFDGDGIADLSASTCTKYGAYRVKPGGLDLLWSATVDDTSGLASTTAFDFLGGGIAQAVYGDQKALYVFDGSNGNKLFDSPRSSGTLIEYPVVADIDNDQSADILVVSNTNGVGTYQHTIQAVEDAQKRWIPTRRVWNQHAYHVTNVREDGTIPKVMAKSWQRLNTFRTNAQIQGNGDCAPPPANPPK